MTLTPHHFADFWRAVHRRSANEAPFPWQQRLVEQICSDGRWPEVIDVPTGLGKTTTLDIATFTLALSLSGAIEARLPRRIFLVIDRRVVVDQSFTHGQRLGDALRDAIDAPGALGEVARALLPTAVTGHHQADPPLVVGRMRGGVSWSWRWLERPDQPAIVVGTIDQLGSRLLFNGYGLGQTLQPLDAALTGSDSLVLVDEAHLAAPFLRTVRDAHALASPVEPLGLPASQVVVMSATAQADGEPPFRASPATESLNQTALDRLHAPKTLVTVEVSTTKARRTQQLAAALASLASGYGTQGAVVGVVANTVDVARATFDILRTRNGVDDSRVLLVTGRQRSIDREALWREWTPRITVGHPIPEEPLYVVATQTIEVGADLDFTALITESCSLDALTQRLGRLNRTGRWAASTAVVVHPGGSADDPIYGAARQATWDWLASHTPPQTLPKRGVPDLASALDASPAALRDLQATAPEPDALRMPLPEIPVLFPGVLERWVRTWPRALDTPPVGPFLHGFDRDVPTVSLLWRWARTGEKAVGDLAASLQLLPPSPDEIVELPVWAAQAWLDGGTAAASAVSDTLEAAKPTPLADAGTRGTIPAVELPLDGAEPRLVTRLRPHSVVAVPTWAGGLDRYGWAPSSTRPVIDVADLATHPIRSTAATGPSRRRRAVLRIGEGTLRQFLTPAHHAWLAEQLRTFTAAHDAGDVLADAVRPFLTELAERIDHADYRDQVTAIVSTVSGEARATWVQNVTEEAATRDDQGPLVLLDARLSLDSWTADSSATGTSQSRERVLLDVHGQAVGARADAFARALHLPESLREAVVMAARWHDLGKQDPRFQRMLTGGVLLPTDPLAKSASRDFVGAAAFERASQAAGYPRGMRHEAFSARAVSAELAEHPERDLIVHLVASHHGRARPLEGAVLDPAPITYSITVGSGRTVTVSTDDDADFDQPRRFAALNARLGPWGLALLEAIVRLADIGCSSEGT